MPKEQRNSLSDSSTENLVTKELLAQIRRIEIKTRRIVDDITAGAYHSVFKGRGIEFDEVREYTPDDDIRDIDWNVTARMGKPYVKKYIEERELTVVLAVDVSASGMFGSKEKTKRQYAVETAALLAFSAIRNNDKVGLLIFSDKNELYIPPKSGKTHGLRIIRELMTADPERITTDINTAVEELMKLLTKRSVIFIISDFLDDHDFSKSLAIASKKHEIIAVRITDPLEIKWPNVGNLMIEDIETGETAFFKGTKSELALFEKFSREISERTQRFCNRAKVDIIDIRCGEDIVKPFVRFFRKRSAFSR